MLAANLTATPDAISGPIGGGGSGAQADAVSECVGTIRISLLAGRAVKLCQL